MSTSIREIISDEDVKVLASLHGAPPELAAATLELMPHLHSTLSDRGLLEPHPEKPHLIWVTPEGWRCFAELATLWSEEELVAYFAGKTSSEDS
jgi:hypothetical protein